MIYYKYQSVPEGAFMDQSTMTGVLIALALIFAFFIFLGTPLRLPNLKTVATLIGVGFLIFLILKFVIV